MSPNRRIASALLALQVIAGSSFAELAPGRLTNPAGFQLYMDVAYNSEEDHYFLAYDGDGTPFGLRLATDGTIISPQFQVGPVGSFSVMAVEYNPDRNEYLYLYRDGQISGQYLTADGSSIGSAFAIDRGGPPDIAYSTASQRYVVVFHDLAANPDQVRWVTIHGDSTSPSPIISNALVQSAATEPHIAYGALSNKFLIVFVQQTGNLPGRANVYGKLLGGNGTGLGTRLTIAAGFENQQMGEGRYVVAAGPSPTAGQDRFLVQHEDWSRVKNNSADVGANYVDSNGAVSSRFYTFVTPGAAGWDVPGPVVYNESTGKFVAMSFYGVTTFAREVDTVTKALGASISVSGNPSTPLAAAARPNAVDPQALILTRTGFGLDGVHAHIVHLPAPPPSFSGTQMPDGFLQVPYSQTVPVVGGTAPLSYQVIGGSLPPGLSGPDGNGILFGTPSQISLVSTPFNFTLKVTDADGREVTGALDHAVKLGAPTPVAPASGAITNDSKATFSWDPRLRQAFSPTTCWRTTSPPAPTAS